MARRSEPAPGWARGFPRVLARTGNAALAAREARLQRSRLYALRGREPGFAGEWDKAEAAARLRLAASGASLPVGEGKARRGRAPRRDGLAELVRWRSKAGAQLTRLRAGMLTAAKAARFLGVLRDCCDVTIAARAAGVRRGTAYRQRRDCADFRAAWDEALADGYHRVERRSWRG